MSSFRAVEFRFLSAQLSSAEKHRFVWELLDYNPNIIDKALFFYIMTHATDAQHINNSINNIILSRESKPTLIVAQHIKLHQIPKNLIGIVSSFLPQSDYHTFVKTNRFIYLSCNSPNQLQSLNLCNIKRYSHINFSLYPSVRHLAFTISQFCEFVSIAPLQSLNSITLGGGTCMEIPEDVHTNVDIFLRSMENDINKSNITKFQCSNFERTFPVDLFIQILSKFRNTEYLSLKRIRVQITTDHIEILKGIYSNLKGLSLCNPRADTFQSSLIHAFGEHLECLSLYQSNQTKYTFDYNLQNVNFAKLQELQLINFSEQTINDILKTAKNVRKFVLWILGTDTKLKELTANWISRCKSLEFICFHIYNYNKEEFQCILEGIENGLFQSAKLYRQKLKITIKVIEVNLNEYLLNIGKVLHWLQFSRIGNFMLVLQSPGICTNTVASKLRDLSSQIEITQSGNDCFVLKNVGCNICGIEERIRTQLVL